MDGRNADRAVSGGRPGATVFRPHVLLRVLPPLVGLVPLPFWIPAAVRDQDLALLPWLLLLSGGLVLAIGVGSWTTSVTLGEEALVVSRGWCTTVLPWSDVAAVTVEGGRVGVTTSSGTHHLPLRPDSRVWSGAPWPTGSLRTPASFPTRPGSFAHAVHACWLQRRGDAWVPPDQLPWNPPADRDGYAVLRARPMSALFGGSGFVGAIAAQTLFPAHGLRTALVNLLVSLPIAATVLGCYWWWARVVVTPEVVVVRSIRGGREVIPRDAILGVEPGTPPFGRRVHRLALVLRDRRRILLPAPWSEPVLRSDPEYYRAWAWLTRELDGNHRPAAVLDTTAVLDTSDARVRP